MLTLEFLQDRETKNAIRFAEVTDRERGIVGTIYVLKSELDTLGYEEGATLTVSIALNGAKPAARTATGKVTSSGRNRRNR
jgi:hypothetical protein